MIDFGGERPAADAAEAITPQHLEPQRSPRPRRSVASRVLGAGPSIRASRHPADRQRFCAHHRDGKRARYRSDAPFSVAPTYPQKRACQRCLLTLPYSRQDFYSQLRALARTIVIRAGLARRPAPARRADQPPQRPSGTQVPDWGTAVSRLSCRRGGKVASFRSTTPQPFSRRRTSSSSGRRRAVSRRGGPDQGDERRAGTSDGLAVRVRQRRRTTSTGTGASFA